MRRNLKKPVALLTAALTAASLLAGCGSSAGESTDAGAQVKETSNANEAAETTAGGSDAEEAAAPAEVTYSLAEGVIKGQIKELVRGTYLLASAQS